jgi:hypothetical protein
MRCRERSSSRRSLWRFSVRVRRPFRGDPGSLGPPASIIARLNPGDDLLDLPLGIHYREVVPFILVSFENPTSMRFGTLVKSSIRVLRYGVKDPTVEEEVAKFS